MADNHLKWYHSTLNDFFSKEEIAELMRKSNWKGALEVAHTWIWIAVAFTLVAVYPHVITVIISLFILGGKQLACAIIMHDASHDSLFTSRKANQIVGNWLGAFPIMHDVRQYRPYHIDHHRTTGLDDDPDLSLTRGYPTTAASMMRKFLRDLIGATGIKGHIGVIAMHFGILKYNLGGMVERINQRGRSIWSILLTGWNNLKGPIVANVVLFGILWLAGHPLLYLLWVGALFTTYNLSLRVRSMAEHSVVPDRLDPHRNTRTTYANWLERMLFAPHHVNYHAEHHLLMGAPSYNYPKMHRMLKERGFYERGLLEQNYWQVVKMAVAGVNTS